MDHTDGATPILIPFDGSRAASAALDAAAWFAARGASTLLLQVLPEPQPIHDVLGRTIVDRDEMDRTCRQAAQAELDSARRRLHALAPTVRVESIVAIGDPAETIVAVARERGAALIVLASHGRGAAPGRPVFGSVAHRVARTAREPVLIVQPDDGAPAPIQRLVVPLDGSPLAEREMPVAAAIARRRDLPAHLLSVVDVADRLVPALDYTAAIGAQRLDELVADCHAAAGQLLEGHGARLLRDGVTATWHVANGPAAATILDALAPGDLLILSSHGVSSVRRWHLGSVAEKLVQNGRAHVLLLPAPPDIVATAEAGAAPAATAPEGRS